SAFGEELGALCARHRTSEERSEEGLLRAEAKKAGVRTVSAVEILYHDRRRRPLQDVLACIRHGCTLMGAGRRIRCNAEHDLKPAREMKELFLDDPEALTCTLDIAERCAFDLGELRYRYPSEALPDGRNESDWLREITFQGARKRYPEGVPINVVRQLDHEL